MLFIFLFFSWILLFSRGGFSAIRWIFLFSIFLCFLCYSRDYIALIGYFFSVSDSTVFYLSITFDIILFC